MKMVKRMGGVVQPLRRMILGQIEMELTVSIQTKKVPKNILFPFFQMYAVMSR